MDTSINKRISDLANFNVRALKKIYYVKLKSKEDMYMYGHPWQITLVILNYN